MENLGDIDVQSDRRGDLHGHARDRRAPAQHLLAGRRADAGARRRLDAARARHEREPEVFRAARVGLGALGVIAEVTLRCVPAFTLRGVDAPAPLARDARALRGAGAGQRPLRVLRLPLCRRGADAHEQPHRRAAAARAAASRPTRTTCCSPTTPSGCSAAPGGAARRDPADQPACHAPGRAQRARRTLGRDLRQPAPGALHRDGVRAAARAHARRRCGA